jgi:ferritin-like metal-binding protein YciE
MRLKNSIDELGDIYSAENQLTKALPKMAKAATSDGLRAGFEEHLEQTKGRVERLERRSLAKSQRERSAKV